MNALITHNRKDRYVTATLSGGELVVTYREKPIYVSSRERLRLTEEIIRLRKLQFKFLQTAQNEKSSNG